MNQESGVPTVTTGSHPRRPPAHLSVSLRHDVPAIENEKPASDTLVHTDTAIKPDGSPTSPFRKQTSDGSEDTSGTNVNEWFDRSNARPAVAINQDSGETSDPPYFLQQSSNDDTDSSKELPLRSKRHLLHPLNDISRSRDGSASDEYRSIIDDLTIENQKLKEKLRRYGRSSVAHLEKEKLFEVKVHALSARKRRELEELLHTFSTSLGSSSEDLVIKGPSSHPSRAHQPSGKASKHKSVSSGSNSRPNDSAYASMSTYGPSHSSSAGEEHRTAQNRDTADRRMQDFLQDIPQGLLPRNSLEMTENQRKRMVVRRLEQLFTGKTGPLASMHSHSLQQQEVSKSAARADQISQNQLLPKEGVREAHIGPHNMELDKQGLVSAQKNSKTSKSPTEQSNSSQSNSSPQKSRGSPSPEQRPTRPLDLDPDRDQIGSDNVEYIRHLGISAPQLLNEESQDAAVDAEGWVYLNLLINMAQLHIINVTPDFIRSAVTELSKKLQISPDGKKLRWRGGTKGTRLSSDSGGSSVFIIDLLATAMVVMKLREKRRKVHAKQIHSHGTITLEIVERELKELCHDWPILI
ncbi:hypothetical protein EYC84_009104 [Monilinia fructicola]|uniref:Frequency clock protein n=1 Tax=Monilinia fructicola TaxID=38448 RepID=A0A5M9JB52_MONFR|nr:hypothetical protein EYC84_009104 [Monilinia fructicola]